MSSALYRASAGAPPAMPALEADVTADVAIVGAGITGLSTALHLAEAGVRVVVLEAHAAGWGASGRNGGQVNPGLKHDPDVVERDFGADLGARMNRLAGNAPALVFELIRRHGIDCESRQGGTLRAAVSEASRAALERSAAELVRRGAPVEVLDRHAVAAATGTDRYRAALLDRRGGDLNPLAYCHGLARAALARGARLHGDSRVLALERLQANGAAPSWRVVCARGAVHASQVILATNGYTDDLWPKLRRTIVPVFGSIAASAPLAATSAILPTGSVLYETGPITVYYRVDAHRRLLIGGRGPQREIDSPAALGHLLDYARQLWPALAGVEWAHAWSGRLAMTQDQYPHLHELAPGILACLGYNGRGVALATAMGAALARRLTRPAEPFDMPLTALRPIRMHRLWPLAVRAVIARGRLAEWIQVSR